MANPLLRALTTTAMLAVALTGCNDEHGRIRTYDVPKEVPPPAPVAAVPPGEMAWDVPEGWSEAANPPASQFSTRVATLRAGDDVHALDVAISRLSGNAGGLSANINMWRGQVGLTPLGETDIVDSVALIRARDAEGILVDVAGEDASLRLLGAIFPTPTNTWFIKMVGDPALIDPQREAFVALCESVRFGAAPAAPAPAPARGGPDPAPSYAAALPAGWERDATPRTMSIDSYTVSAGDDAASMTVTPLGGNQDLLANINRWRGQVGLDPMTQVDDDPPAAITIDGINGDLVDMAGPNGHTIAAIVVRNGTTWFFKLTGPDPLVADQHDAFVTFVTSASWNGEAQP